MMRLSAFFFLTVFSYLTAAEINPADLVAGKAVTVDLAHLGKSWRSKGKSPIQMKFILPANYSAERSWPLMLHLGGGSGSPTGCDRWSKLMENKHFVVLGVDYDARSGYHSGFNIAEEAIKLLETKIKIDRSRMLVSGFSSGAYAITDGIGGKIGMQFNYLIPIGGGMEINPKIMKKKSVIWLCGGNDKQKASAGRARVDVQKNAHAVLTKAKCDTTLFIIPGVGHAWPKQKDAEIRQWAYERILFPPLEKKLKEAESFERRKQFAQAAGLYKQLSEFDYKNSRTKFNELNSAVADAVTAADKLISGEKDYFQAATELNKIIKIYGADFAAAAAEKLAEVRRDPGAIADIKGRYTYFKAVKAAKNPKITKAKVKAVLEKVIAAAPGSKTAVLSQQLIEKLGQ